MTDSLKRFFSKHLLVWAEGIQRPLPWKYIDNAYHILLSEYILQQTRARQALPYYTKFIKAFPTVRDLANADQDVVLKVWQGLGYYSRARNLHFAANQIMNDFNGRVPDNFEDLKKLKGVGDYTAAAVASFAFNRANAVVDGNVYRVLSRFFTIDEDFYSSTGKKLYTKLANDLIDKNKPAVYNQAIMDFGAIQCIPKNPNCSSCILKTKCISYRINAISKYPPPKRKIKKKIRYFHFIVLRDKMGEILIKQRVENDIWKGLYDFPLIEKYSPGMIPKTVIEKFIYSKLQIQGQNITYNSSVELSQVLTHQKIYSTFYLIDITKHKKQTEPYFLLNPKNLSKFAFPKSIDCYLKDNYLNLYIKNSYSW